MTRIPRALAPLALSLVAAAGLCNDGGPPLTGYGTAVVDGTLDPVEWANAATIPFFATLPGGAGTTGTLYVMNDRTTLYLGVWVNGWDASKAASASFNLDSNDDGICETGEDSLLAGNAGFDDEYTFAFPSPNGNCSTYQYDTSGGGTSDGSSAVGAGTGGAFFELGHPLASGDTTHDINVAAGGTIGLAADITLCDGVCTTSYPTPASFATCPSVLISNVVFDDGFEGGTPARWSSTTP